MHYRTPHTLDTMSEKRKRTSEATSGDHTNKRKKGFVVGPDNLPDGTYKRKGISLALAYLATPPC